jgi:hypothetical protein
VFRLSKLREWLVIEESREKVTAALAAAFFISILSSGIFDLTPLRQIMTTSDPVETLFYGYLTSLITGVTLVVTINQLVLSQELGPLGDQKSRMEGSLNVRKDAEQLFDEVSSEKPSEFMKQILGTAYQKASEFHSTTGDTQIGSDIAEIAKESEKAANKIENTQFGEFDLVNAALDYDYSQKLYTVRSAKKENRDELKDRQVELLNELEHTIGLFGPAREHLKTLYFQWELINLSRRIIYVAIPAILVTSAIVLYLDAESFPGLFLGIDNIIWVTSLAATIAVTPFLILTSYILRIGTIAKRTLAIGPFILEDQD